MTATAGRESSAVKQAVAAAPPAAVAAPTPATPAAPSDSAPADPGPAPATPANPNAPAAPASPATPAAPADPASPGGSSGTGGANSGNEGGAGSGAGGGTRGGNGNHRGSGDGSTPARSHGPRRPAWLSAGDQPYSAALYDPYGNGEDEHASAAPKAVDGRAGTSWTTATHPGALGKPGVGLVVEASGYQSYSAIGIQTATPGIDVAIYSTDASDPPQGGPDQPGWKLEATKPSIKGQQRIALKGATADPHYLIVWITKLAQGKPRASLSEISLLP